MTDPNSKQCNVDFLLQKKGSYNYLPACVICTPLQKLISNKILVITVPFLKSVNIYEKNHTAYY